MQDIADEHSKSLDDVLKLFGTVNCDKQRLRDLLSQKSYERWTTLEDLSIRQATENEEQFSALLEMKGIEEVKKRRKFLELPPLDL